MNLNYFLILLMMLSSAVSMGQSRVVHQFNVLSSSSLRINGSSNVNKFCCSLEHGVGMKKLKATVSAANKVELDGVINVKVRDIDCGKRLMNRDFRRTLKADEYPDLSIGFISLSADPFQGSNKQVTGRIVVELAGQRKEFQLAMKIAKVDGNTYKLTGAEVFQFADFKLIPPDKLGGLIKVRDSFDVSFILMLRKIS